MTSVLQSLAHFEVAGTPLDLRDYFLVDLRNRVKGVKESLEQGKLFDAGKMDQRAGVWVARGEARAQG